MNYSQTHFTDTSPHHLQGMDSCGSLRYDRSKLWHGKRNPEPDVLI